LPDLSTLHALYKELDEWNFIGEEALLWWRDDDARSDTAALDTLLRLSNRFDIPLALAVIPDGLDASLTDKLRPYSGITVLQHGYAHTNHAPEERKKQELGPHRPLEVIGDELARGYRHLAHAFPTSFFPILVPPWNRIDARLIPRLSGLGYQGLSTFKAGARAGPVAALRTVNTHVDIIHWKDGKKFAGAGEVIAQLVDHLSGKRTGRYDPAEPTGLLTHHLVQDAVGTEFLIALFAALDDHPAVKWIDARTAFRLDWR